MAKYKESTAPDPVYTPPTEAIGTGMQPRVGFPDVDLYPRYPLNVTKELKKVLPDTDIECRYVDPMNNVWKIEDDNQEVLYANHPWKPKGRK